MIVLPNKSIRVGRHWPNFDELGKCFLNEGEIPWLRYQKDVYPERGVTSAGLTGSCVDRLWEGVLIVVNQLDYTEYVKVAATTGDVNTPSLRFDCLTDPV